MWAQRFFLRVSRPGLASFISSNATPDVFSRAGIQFRRISGSGSDEGRPFGASLRVHCGKTMAPGTLRAGAARSNLDLMVFTEIRPLIEQLPRAEMLKAFAFLRSRVRADSDANKQELARGSAIPR